VKKLLVVYNTCGISGRVNVNYYINALQSIFNQDLEDVTVALSTCCNDNNHINQLLTTFPNLVCNANLNKVPISVTFNDTVDQCVEHLGEFEGYVFVDSGIIMQKSDDLRQLYNLFKENEDTISARTDRDTGFETWFNTTDFGGNLFEHNHLSVDVGKAVNLHVQIFSNSWRQMYNRILPDIFAGQCMESVFSFMAAALHKKWIVNKDVVVVHNTGMDGPSSGFVPLYWEQAGNKRWEHPFVVPSIVDIVNKGIKYGMGYEELQEIVMHNPDLYDENGYSKDDRLSGYIRDNLFLSQQQFNYSQMNSQFILP
tara:strand:+ start:1884 stop:2819 length:936 start_codon:yes stop_codon:yes gene_type:complete